MAIARPLPDVHAELADEHRCIMALIARIEAGVDADELPETLQQLHDLLVDHFAHEQFPGGLYEQLGAYGPQHHEDLKVLIREHCLVLSAARALVEQARGANAEAAARLDDDVAALLAMLREHEVKEHRLVEKLKADAA